MSTIAIILVALSIIVPLTFYLDARMHKGG